MKYVVTSTPLDREWANATAIGGDLASAPLTRVARHGSADGEDQLAGYVAGLAYRRTFQAADQPGPAED